MELKLGSRQRDAAQRTPELLTHMNATRLHLHQGSRSVLASQSGCIRCDERYATTLKLKARAPCPPSSAFHVCVPSCPGTEAKGSTLASHNAQEKMWPSWIWTSPSRPSPDASSSSCSTPRRREYGIKGKTLAEGTAFDCPKHQHCVTKQQSSGLYKTCLLSQLTPQTYGGKSRCGTCLRDM